MVCKRCESKLSAIVTPEVWKEGSKTVTGSSFRKINENKLLSSKNKNKFAPYEQKCKRQVGKKSTDETCKSDDLKENRPRKVSRPTRKSSRKPVETVEEVESADDANHSVVNAVATTTKHSLPVAVKTAVPVVTSSAKSPVAARVEQLLSEISHPQPTNHSTDLFIESLKKFLNQLEYEKQLSELKSENQLDSLRKTINDFKSEWSEKAKTAESQSLESIELRFRQMQSKYEKEIFELKDTLSKLALEMDAKDLKIEKLLSGSDQVENISLKRLSMLEEFTDNQRIDNENIKQTIQSIEMSLLGRMEAEQEQTTESVETIKETIDKLVQQLNLIKSAISLEAETIEPLSKKRKLDAVGTSNMLSRLAASGVAAALWFANN